MTIFFQKNNKNFETLGEAISAACEGLTYTSETDAPVLPFAGTNTNDVTGETILHQAGLDASAAVEEADFDAFFDRLTTIKDWFGEAEKAKAENFAELKTVLVENLRDRKVFKVGRVQLNIFAVGIDADGCLAGVRTKAVET